MLSLGNVNTQNPLNKSNGLLRGLVHFWMPLPNGKSSIDTIADLNNINNVHRRDSNTEFTVRNGKVVFKNFATEINHSESLARGPFTVIFIGHLDSGVTTNNYIGLINKLLYTNESSNSGWGLQIDGQGGTANFGPGIRINNNNGIASYSFPAVNTAWPSGPLFCAATYDGTTRTLYRAPNSKGAIQVTSGTATLLPSSNRPILIASSPFTGTRPAYCEAALIYNRVLSYSEIKRIQQEWMSDWPSLLNRRRFPINRISNNLYDDTKLVNGGPPRTKSVTNNLSNLDLTNPINYKSSLNRNLYAWVMPTKNGKINLTSNNIAKHTQSGATRLIITSGVGEYGNRPTFQCETVTRFITLGSSIEMGNSNNFTVELAYYPTATGESRLFTLYSGASTSAFIVTFSRTNANRFGFYYNANTQTNGTTTYEINKWYHIVVVVNGTSIKLFVNGKLEHSVINAQNPMAYHSTTATIGARLGVYIGRIQYVKFLKTAVADWESNAMYSEWRAGFPTTLNKASYKIGIYNVNDDTRPSNGGVAKGIIPGAKHSATLSNIDMRQPISNNPLNNGLVALYVPLNRNGLSGFTTLYDLAGKNHARGVRMTQAFTRVTVFRNKIGIRYANFSNLTTNNTSSYHEAPKTSRNSISGAFTVFAYFTAGTFETASKSNITGIITRYSYATDAGTTSNNRSYALGCNNSSGRKLLGIVSSNGTTGEVLNGTTTLIPGELYSAVFVFVPGVSTTLYLNGIIDATFTTSVTSLFSSSIAPVRIGSIGTSQILNGMDGYIYSAGIYNRALTSGEIHKLHDEMTLNFPTMINRLPTNFAMLQPETSVVTAYKEVGFKWNIFATIGKSSSILWNTLILAGLSKQFLWNVYITVGKNEELVWNALQLAGVDMTAVYNVYAVASKTSSFLWNVSQLSSKQLDILWNNQQLAGKTTELIWNQNELVNKETGIVWNIRELAGKDGELSWNTRGLAGADSELVWNTNELAGKEVQLIWDTKELVGSTKTIQLVWNTRQNAAKEVELSWNLFQLVNKNIDVLWNTYQTAGTNVEFKYHVRELVFKSFESVWNVRQLSSAELELLWNVISDVSVSTVQEIMLHIRQGVNVDLSILQQELLSLKIKQTKDISFGKNGVNNGM